MIGLFTDYGCDGPYIGQVLARILALAPAIPVINLFADAPAHNPRAAAYLLPAYTSGYPAGTVFVCVVDPAVGSGRHRPAILDCDGRWFVGPDNGLFEIIRRRTRILREWQIEWRPEDMAASFHGRDLYAPVAARLAMGMEVARSPLQPLRFAEWPDDLDEIIYIDRFGNTMSGMRASSISPQSTLRVAGKTVAGGRTFAAVNEGEGVWYGNSNGLVEVAINGGRADVAYGLRIGSRIEIG
jgi:S-adenosylmethionine hydrolase